MRRLSAATAFIGLGSNLGDREANLSEAIERIKSSGLDVLRRSSVYETEPVDYTAQPWFLNQVIEIGASMIDLLEAGRNLPSPARLLGLLLEIERDMGRMRTAPSGPRLIDLDLLLYGELVVSERLESVDMAGRVIVPHPRLHLRRFVLCPLCEIDPLILHPVLAKTCGELLSSLEDNSVVRAIQG